MGGLLFLLVLIPLTWYLSLHSGFRGRVAKIAAAGDPVSLEDLVPQPVPEAENSALVLSQASAGIAALSEDLREIIENRQAEEALLAEQLSTIESAWQSHDDVYATIERAARLQNYVPKRDHTAPVQAFSQEIMSSTQEWRRVQRLLALRAEWLAAEGNGDEAIDTCLTMLRFARLTDREPGMISFLVGCALRHQAVSTTSAILRQATISPSAHSQLEKELSLHENRDRYVWQIKSERVMAIEQLTEQAPFWMPGKARILDLFERNLAFADQPYAEVKPLFDARESNTLGTLTAGVASSLTATRVAADRTTAQVRCLRILNSLMEAEAEPTDGGYDVSSLKLPRQATTDPFSGKYLHLKHVDGGWLIYSVGTNLIDDEGDNSPGENSQPKDVGLLPRGS